MRSRNEMKIPVRMAALSLARFSKIKTA